MVKAQLVYDYEDFGYVTYVFELLDPEDKDRLLTKYMMCVQFPNWEQKEIKVGDKGFLQYKEINKGIDEYYDFLTKSNKKYLHDMVQFIKFIPIKEKVDNINIID